MFLDHDLKSKKKKNAIKSKSKSKCDQKNNLKIKISRNLEKTFFIRKWEYCDKIFPVIL
jgi:ribosomal protein S8